MDYDSIKASAGIADWEAPPREGGDQIGIKKSERSRIDEVQEEERVFVIDDSDRYWLTLNGESSFPIVTIDVISAGISHWGGEPPSVYMPRWFTANRDEDSMLNDDAFAPPEASTSENTKTIFREDFEFDPL